MRTFETSEIDWNKLNDFDRELCYNGMDTLLTMEIKFALEQRLVEPYGHTYEEERSMLGPVMTMMRRGMPIDPEARASVLKELEARITLVEGNFKRLCAIVGIEDINPRSYVQLGKLFWEVLSIPKHASVKKGKVSYTLDRDALEKLSVAYVRATPFCNMLMRLRDLSKTRDALSTTLSKNNRWHASFNIAGTDCVAADTLIMTKGGLRKMGEIYESSEPFAVYDGKDYFTPARKVKYENHSGYVITLQHGYSLRCSSNHPVMTQRGFIEARDLSYTDRVAVFVGHPEYQGNFYVPKVELSRPETWGNRTKEAMLPRQITAELAEWYGMYLADGSVTCSSEKYEVRLSNSDPKIQKRFIELTEEVFSLPCNTAHDAVYVRSRNLAEWLIGTGVPCGLGHEMARVKKIPGWLIRSKPKHIRALLRGLTLDSHAAEGDFCYGTQSPELQEQVQQLLLLLGFISTKVSCGTSMKLTISRPQVGKFLWSIGCLRDNVVTALFNHIPGQSWHEPPAFGQYIFLPIALKASWVGDVYDVTMPNEASPQYHGNGMLVHNTGRWSSRSHPLDMGNNLQNIDDELRRAFVPDPGYVMFSCDQNGAESRAVAYLSGDPGYIKAVESSDIHTTVSSMVFGTAPNKDAAEVKYYRDLSYRDMAKRGSHGSNYFGQPPTIAKHLKVETALIEEFQRKYFRAFPGIRDWQTWVSRQIQALGYLDTPFGRRRHFWGRTWDDTTLRAAIAYVPQSTVGEHTARGIRRIWEELEPRVQIFNNGHDAVIGQIKEERLAEDLDLVVECLTQPINITDIHGITRSVVIPWEVSIGKNWGKRFKDKKTGGYINPRGLRVYEKANPDLQW